MAIPLRVGAAARSAIVDFLDTLKELRKNIQALAKAVSSLASSGPLLIGLQQCCYFTDTLIESRHRFIHTDQWVYLDTTDFPKNVNESTFEQGPNVWKVEQVARLLAICLTDAQLRLHKLADLSILRFDGDNIPTRDLPQALELETLLASIHIDIKGSYAAQVDHPACRLENRHDDLYFLFVSLDRNWQHVISALDRFSKALQLPDPNAPLIADLSQHMAQHLADLQISVEDFAVTGTPVLLKRQKRQSEGNTALSAAALLFANTVAQVGNSQLFSAASADDGSPPGPGSKALQAIQALWTISLTTSILSFVLAAAAAYWREGMWSRMHHDDESKQTGRIRQSAERAFGAVLRYSLKLGPLLSFSISVVSFLGGLCASTYNLNFTPGTKITTLVCSGLFVPVAVLLVASFFDNNVRRLGDSQTYQARLFDHDVRQPGGTQTDQA